LIREQPKLFIKDCVMHLIADDVGIETSLKSTLSEFKHLVASVVYRRSNRSRDTGGGRVHNVGIYKTGA
jgi:hypothetical protein